MSVKHALSDESLHLLGIAHADLTEQGTDIDEQVKVHVNFGCR
jgi:hypothetical protein